MFSFKNKLPSMPETLDSVSSLEVGRGGMWLGHEGLFFMSGIKALIKEALCRNLGLPSACESEARDSTSYA